MLNKCIQDKQPNNVFPSLNYFVIYTKQILIGTLIVKNNHSFSISLHNLTIRNQLPLKISDEMSVSSSEFSSWYLISCFRKIADLIFQGFAFKKPWMVCISFLMNFIIRLFPNVASKLRRTERTFAILLATPSHSGLLADSVRRFNQSDCSIFISIRLEFNWREIEANWLFLYIGQIRLCWV